MSIFLKAPPIGKNSNYKIFFKICIFVHFFKSAPYWLKFELYFSKNGYFWRFLATLRRFTLFSAILAKIKNSKISKMAIFRRFLAIFAVWRYFELFWQNEISKSQFSSNFRAKRPNLACFGRFAIFLKSTNFGQFWAVLKWAKSQFFGHF